MKPQKVSRRDATLRGVLIAVIAMCTAVGGTSAPQWAKEVAAVIGCGATAWRAFLDLTLGRVEPTGADI